jgi:hypothetical protein
VLYHANSEAVVGPIVVVWMEVCEITMLIGQDALSHSEESVSKRFPGWDPQSFNLPRWRPIPIPLNRMSLHRLRAQLSTPEPSAGLLHVTLTNA